jgi:hypothetical protein
MFDELGAALFDRLPRKVQIGCMTVFWGLVVAGGIWMLLDAM